MLNGNALRRGRPLQEDPRLSIADRERHQTYKSKDGAYVTTKVGDDYYMPLVLNWYGTSDNPFTDQLMTGFASRTTNIDRRRLSAMQNTIGRLLARCWTSCIRHAVYGYYSGSPDVLRASTIATGFTSAAYDYSYQTDPSIPPCTTTILRTTSRIRPTCTG